MDISPQRSADWVCLEKRPGYEAVSDTVESASKDGNDKWWPLMMQAHPLNRVCRASIGTVQARFFNGEDRGIVLIMVLSGQVD